MKNRRKIALGQFWAFKAVSGTRRDALGTAGTARDRSGREVVVNDATALKRSNGHHAIYGSRARANAAFCAFPTPVRPSIHAVHSHALTPCEIMCLLNL